jgi:hypothetical protein
MRLGTVWQPVMGKLFLVEPCLLLMATIVEALRLPEDLIGGHLIAP